MTEQERAAKEAFAKMQPGLTSRGYFTAGFEAGIARAAELETGLSNMTDLWMGANERAKRAEAQVAALGAALNISAGETGPIGHEAWMVIKRSKGFHGPHEQCDQCATLVLPETCTRIHEGLVAWEQLSDYWREFDVAIFDRILEEIRRRSALTADVRALVEQRQAEQRVVQAAEELHAAWVKVKAESDDRDLWRMFKEKQDEFDAVIRAAAARAEAKGE